MLETAGRRLAPSAAGLKGGTGSGRAGLSPGASALSSCPRPPRWGQECVGGCMPHNPESSPGSTMTPTDPSWWPSGAAQ